MDTFWIDFADDTTVTTSDWDAMAQYINRGDVIMVIVTQTDEILFDSLDGWDIVTDVPPRVL